MLLWILRGLALLGSPALAYYLVSPDTKGIIIGTVFGAVLVGLEFLLESVSLMAMMIGVAGAIMGIIVSKLLDSAVVQIDHTPFTEVWNKFHILTQYSFALLGVILAVRKVPELEELDKDIAKIGKRRGSGFKMIDTSAVIDGRIIDICDTHFLSGTIVAPRFVLNELHQLADSHDQLKRARGRRGLDILARLQESKDVPFKVIDKEVPELKDIDAKIIRIARDMGACIITTDFNMNKMASLEGVTVLNINDLSTALKPVVLPGENMSLFIMKDGKEKEQGVGYLDDGTMVVVEEGKKWIGKRIEVAVYSILQTSSGRMIFAKAKWDGKVHEANGKGLDY